MDNHPKTVLNLYNKILILKLSKKVYEAEAAGLEYSIGGEAYGGLFCYFFLFTEKLFLYLKVNSAELIKLYK